MRRASAVLLSVLVVGLLLLAFPAFADPHPNSCATPEAGMVGNGVFVCTPIGYGAVSADDGGYILLDGASSNPDPLDGYVVVTAGGVGCNADGDWNPGDPVACNPSVPSP